MSFIFIRSMTKKEFILQALWLFPNREMGRWIKAMVENDQLEDHAINVLVVILKRWIDKLNEVVGKYKMNETIERTDQFQRQQEQQQKQDQEDLSKLDSMLDNF